MEHKESTATTGTYPVTTKADAQTELSPSATINQSNVLYQTLRTSEPDISMFDVSTREVIQSTLKNLEASRKRRSMH